MTYSQSSQERRRSPRLEHTVPLKLSSGDIEIVTETSNLSSSGVYCRVNAYIEPMTKLKIHLLLPIKKNSRTSTKRISCQGVVVRAESVPDHNYFNAAIFFNDIQPKDIQTISDFIEHMLDSGEAHQA
ncbi:MAG: PilZ domain-containing protein [Candidatus Omnitrophica bacterium]|nr:PilZ domain-containing protein [Candidatus Omnitrophota bacterium]